MPIEVTWDNPEKTIMQYRLTDPWSWDDFYNAIERGQAMRAADNAGGISLIINFTGAKTAPNGAISHFATMARRKTSTSGKIRILIFVNTNPFFRAIIDILAKLVPGLSSRTDRVASLEEAYALIRSHQQVVP